ncbi:MAG: hypothetical protein Q4F72_12160 [Desulfovibrionaceae bacterium]|nr:hypothetical protein [Desulfovibrionaceae bacterium]
MTSGPCTGMTPDFALIDEPAPECVVRDILDLISEQTDGLVRGSVSPCGGIPGLDELLFPESCAEREALAGEAAPLYETEEEADLARPLVAARPETRADACHVYLCSLYTPARPSCRCRPFAVRYGLSAYPAELRLDRSLAQSLPGLVPGAQPVCRTSFELQDMLLRLFSTSRMAAVMQSLARLGRTGSSDMAPEVRRSGYGV